jgi:hypothetical protein
MYESELIGLLPVVIYYDAGQNPPAGADRENDRGIKAANINVVIILLYLLV